MTMTREGGFISMFGSSKASGRWAWALMGQPKKPGPVAGLSRPMDKPVAKCGISVVDGPGLAWATKKAYSACR